MNRLRLVVLGLVGWVIALFMAGPAAALPRTIDWVSPPGAGGPFTESSGVNFPTSGASGDVCGARRGRIDILNQAVSTASTPDDSRVFFTSMDRLTAEDTDTDDPDVYEFSNGQTKLVSVPPPGVEDFRPAFLTGCSTDGTKVFFTVDTFVLFTELFERSAGTTKQVNVSETGAAPNSVVRGVAISADGNTVIFDTAEPLTSDDNDGGAPDVYERSGNDTDLISAVSGTEAADASVGSISADGSRAYFSGRVDLAAEDTNTAGDVYLSTNNGAPVVLSIDPGTGEAAGGDVSFGSQFLEVTPSGSHVYFRTTTQIEAADLDTDLDLFVRNVGAGTTDWVSEPDAGGTQGSFPDVSAVSPDGMRVFFSSDAALKTSDTDTATDLYLRNGSALVHVTQQVAGDGVGVQSGCNEISVIRSCASLDASRIFFATQERLTASDSDTNSDIYRFTAPSGPLELVSGSGEHEYQVGGTSEDGSRVFFDSSDPLVSCLDTDTSDSDVYEWENGALTLVTPPLGPQQAGNVLSSMSSDAATVFFTSSDRYAGSNDDGFAPDLFAARPGGAAATCPGTDPGPGPNLSPSGANAPQCSDGADNDGDGAKDKSDPGCLRDGEYDPLDDDESNESLSDLVLCGRREISLVRADQIGTRVILKGLVSARFARKAVDIYQGAGKPKKIASVKAAADGQFTARLKKPPRRLFKRIRYSARVGSFKSVELKLPQSLASSSVRRRGDEIELRGRVKRSLLGDRKPIVIRRLVCGGSQKTATTRAKPNGSYVARFKAPPQAAAALYRAETMVLARPGSRRYVRQFARAIAIRLTGESG